MRWLYHVAERPFATEATTYAPPSLAAEGFVHCSYQSAVRETVALYYEGKDVVIAQIDPRWIGSPLREASTPRGPMPHVHGPIARDAFVRLWELSFFDGAPDAFCEASAVYRESPKR